MERTCGTEEMRRPFQNVVPGRLKSPWKIFFSGVDWKRKGGDRCVAILNELVKLGLVATP